MYTAYLLTTDVHIFICICMYTLLCMYIFIFYMHVNCLLFGVYVCFVFSVVRTQRSLHILKLPELVAVTTVDVPSQCLHLIRSGVPQVHVQQVQACEPTVCTFRCTYVQYVYILYAIIWYVCILCMYSI